MDVPLPENGDMFDDVFAAALCIPALEPASAHLIIALARICDAHGRPRSLIGGFRYACFKAGSADAYKCARAMAALSPFASRILELARKFEMCGHGLYKRGYALEYHRSF